MAAVGNKEKLLTPHPVLHNSSPPPAPGHSRQVLAMGDQQSCDWHLHDSLGVSRCALNHLCLGTVKRMGTAWLRKAFC